MICRSSIRRFDGDASASFHAAVLTRGATGLRFVAWAVLDKAAGVYAPNTDAPAITVAWVPAETITDETSSPTEIDGALADSDQVPLIVLPRRERAVAYISDAGAAFPVVGIKGKAMVLVARLSAIVAGTHGQLTFGWEGQRC